MIDDDGIKICPYYWTDFLHLFYNERGIIYLERIFVKSLNVFEKYYTIFLFILAKFFHSFHREPSYNCMNNFINQSIF